MLLEYKLWVVISHVEMAIQVSLVFPFSRVDVLTLTPWMAPIVWDGTFDPAVVHALHPPDNLSIILAVFVVGK